MTMVVFTGAGSAYDVYARALARHMGNNIPGRPTFVVQNMIGAGGLKAVDYIWRIAPKDGTVVATIGRGLPFEPMLGKANEVTFDPFKLTWLGSMNREVSLAMAWHTAKVKSFTDLRQHDLLVPGTGAGADSEIIPLAINSLAGTRFKIVNGYRNTSEAALALERGELDGLAYWSWSSIMGGQPHWVTERKVNLLFHTGVKPIAATPLTPAIRDLVGDAGDRKALEFILAREIIGRPFIAPPGLPPERAKALRDAFIATLKDPAFLREAERTKLDTDLVTGEEVDRLLADIAASPKAVVDRVKAALERQ